MMNEMQVFTNEQFGQVRTVLIEGEPWFVAVDVCKALEIKNSSCATTRLDDDEKGVVLTDTLGGAQSVAIINEPGLYVTHLSHMPPCLELTVNRHPPSYSLHSDLIPC